MAVPNGDNPQQRDVPHRNAPGGALGGAITPFVHTGSYIARSWRDYLGQAPDQLPIARPTIALAAQAFRDEVVLTGLKARRPVSRPEVFERITREVIAAVEFYGDKGWLEKPRGFFAKPPALSRCHGAKGQGAQTLLPSHRLRQRICAAPGRTRCATMDELPGEQS